MRRGLGYFLIGLGTFLLVLAPLLKWYAAPRLAVAPLGCTGDVLCDNGVSISPSTGTATTLFDPATLSPRTNVELTATRRVKPDVQASTGADNRTVYDSFQEVVDSNGKLVDASTERIAFNGHTSAMIDCCGANLDGTAITDFNGIAPYKFPFNVEQKTYQYFDGTLGKALPAEFKGEEQVEGLNTYKFVQVIEPTQYAELEVPGNLVGSTDPSVKAPRFYSNTRTLWVDPTTGAVVKGQEQQKQTLRDAAGGEDKLTVIEANLGFTPENVTNSVKTAKDGAAQLNLIQNTLPLVGLLGGLVSLGLGLWLALAGRRDEENRAAYATTGSAAPVQPVTRPTVTHEGDGSTTVRLDPESTSDLTDIMNRAKGQDPAP